MQVSAPVRVGTAQSQDAVVFDVATDVTLTKLSSTFGGIVKRGAGTLTVEVPANTSYNILNTAYNGGDLSETNAKNIGCQFAADGSVNGVHGVFDVAEGELVLRGTGANASLTANSGGWSVIGLPVASAAAQSALTIDNLYFKFSTTVFAPGYTLGMSTASAGNRHPVIRILNGGVLEAAGGLQVGYACTAKNTFVTFAMTNGTYIVSSSSS